ncbi:glycosyltransferase family 4 protein [Gordonia sp. ABSL49_1]|uniref:glycosyltransferase family 4 protein n=1 Tax=Gordonia sp. ABSL49_1 TaxID=2920941 RepID=UPI001F105AAB|nr:glycosyltransferase family 4 protein [Gordonia sp. ABSL49_1]MCH5641229.1 glycosyltransferase family 4 protein [Gordonia sp. ABSL49_1]
MPESPLRIALIASSRHPIAQPFAGGLEAHIWHLTRALTAAGHHVTLFAADGSDVGTDRDSLRAEHFTPSPAAARDVSMPHYPVLEEHHAYLSLMIALANGTHTFDLVHNHSLHYLPIAMAPSLDIPMLTTLHTPPTPWLESAMTIFPGAHCAAVSEHTARAWSHVVADIAVVPNGVDTEQWPTGAGGPDLVWFGRLVPEKGPHVAMEVARRTGRRLRLAGPVSDREYFADRIAPGLDDRIVYVGHLEQPALAQLVGASAVTLVTPRWDEPYGLVAAESLSCGTPVAGFGRGGLPEVVGHGAGVLVGRDDVEALVAAVEDAARLDRAAVRRHAVAHCSQGAMVDRYLQVYTSMVSRPVAA